MTTMLMLFILPLGIIFYFFDKKTRKQNKKLLEEHSTEIKNYPISDKEKIDKIDEMYYQNSYKRVMRDENSLIMEKKHFNLGLLFIYFGLLSYFGFLAYFIYYKFILKPEQIKITLDE